MKTYTVEITQKLTGWVEIEANSEAEAIEKAKDQYITNGAELPSMEDCNDLEFYI